MQKTYFLIIFGKFFPKTKRFFDTIQLAHIFIDEFFHKNMPRKLKHMLKEPQIEEMIENSYTLVEIDCAKCNKSSKLFFPGRAPVDKEIQEWLNDDKPNELLSTGTEEHS